MVVEYLLLLVVSAMILAGAFGLKTGPVAMFKEGSPFLAFRIESHLESGECFRYHSGKAPGTVTWEGQRDIKNPCSR